MPFKSETAACMHTHRPFSLPASGKRTPPAVPKIVKFSQSVRDMNVVVLIHAA
jgi:hypothetical protein